MRVEGAVDIMKAEMGADTPMMRQYKRIKRLYPDAILMFRLGDFYEMFFDDAVEASRLLGLTLTSRNKGSPERVPLCGVPYHSVEGYIARLLEAGRKVAVCEQVEDPKLAKGLVERRVTRVLTPGVVLDTEKLDSKTGNYLAAVSELSGRFGLAVADLSTGEFRATSFASVREVAGEIAVFAPRELVAPEGASYVPELLSLLGSDSAPSVTELEPWVWDVEAAREALMDHFGVSTLEGFGVEGRPEAVAAAGAALHYLQSTQMDDLPPLRGLSYYERGDYVTLDAFTRANLELERTLRGGGRAHTLLGVLDKTCTAMGGRLLKEWMRFPLLDVDRIRARHEAVEELVAHPAELGTLRKALRQIADLERLIGRICTSYAKPTDLAALRDSIYFVAAVRECGGRFSSPLLARIRDELDDLADVASLVERAIVPSPPAVVTEGGVIRDGFSAELDQLRALLRDGKQWIADLERRERDATGIASLKVGYNKVFGYYVEVTKPNLHLVPEHYTRKQTLVGAERFVTPELKEYEEKVLSAEERARQMEKMLFEEVRLEVASHVERVRKTASLIAAIDVLASFAEAAEAYGYRRPAVTTHGVIELKQCRHPVVERVDLGERFVPNDVRLDTSENRLLIITGPNMSGKSTLMRQVALAVLMAQMGSFIPAETGSRIGVVDRIFTRVGASDDLASGRSTFMVEMVETAYILRHATRRSLVILDEIGRGTSTYDGMSLAWAVAEYIYNLGARTMFATHYHELAELALLKKGVKNYNVSVKREGERIVFLRKLLPGATSRSYGIEVARLAGVPEQVLKSARSVLARLERSPRASLGGMVQESLFVEDEGGGAETKDRGVAEEVIEQLRSLDPDEMTPLEALGTLARLKKKVEKV